MPEPAFTILVDKLRPRRPSRGLSDELRPAMALRYVGSGSYPDICAAFGVATATIYNCPWEVVDTVNASASLDFIFIPGDPVWR